MQSENLKPWTFRIPETVLDWFRIRAAQRTILEGRNISLNQVAIEALSKAARESDRD